MKKQLTQTERKRRGLIAGISAVGLSFAILSVIFKPFGMFAYIVNFLVSLGLGFMVNVMAQGLDTSKNQKNSSSPAVNDISKDTGNPEIDEVLKKGRDMLIDIHLQNEKIPDIEFSASISNLEGKVARILQVVYEQPDKAPRIRKFINYYLPTTQKMLQKYADIDRFSSQGENIVRTKKRIEEAVAIVNDACDKQLDMLYHDDMIDITTDIEALEKMLKRDGLVENELNKMRAQSMADN